MEDCIEVILQNEGPHSPRTREHPWVTACTGAMLTSLYGLWSLFALPGLRRVPWKLQFFVLAPNVEKGDFWRSMSPLDVIAAQIAGVWDFLHVVCLIITSTYAPICRWVPFLPSSKQQTVNVLRHLRGRSGRLADLGSGDGRLVFAACSAGFQCTGFEINSILVAYARARAHWAGLSCSQAVFVKTDFWKTDLSSYNNVTAFLAPGAMEALSDKLLKELPDDAFVVTCRFPFRHWPSRSSLGSGLDRTWAYDMSAVRASLSKSTSEI